MLQKMANVALVTLALNILNPSVSVEELDSKVPPDCNLTPVMMEEFNDLSISSSVFGPTRWTAHTPWNGDFGDAQFLDPSGSGPFEIKNNILTITASKQENGKWTSGLIAAADATGAGTGTQYGYFEARMKMPPGPGTWPAFWLASLKPANTGDGNVEIDIIEYYGQFPSAYHSVVHVWFKDRARSIGSDKIVRIPENSLIEEFHTFGVDISPQNIVFIRDGVEQWSFPTPHELNGPMYPLLNLALGGGWPIDETPNPSVLLIDYVQGAGGHPRAARSGFSVPSRNGFSTDDIDD